MIYRDGTTIPLEDVNFLLDAGGLGDAICRLPALKYILANYLHVVPHVWVPDYFLEFARFCFPETIIEPFSRNKFYCAGLPGMSTKDGKHSSMRTHLVDYSFNVLVDKQVEIEHKNYLQIDTNSVDISSFNLPEEYVIITTGYTASVREMLPDIVNAITTFLEVKNIVPVFLGNEVTKAGGAEDIVGTFKEEIDFSKGISLINKTSLLQAHHIISKAQCIIGVDNGLIHLAGMTATPIVAGYTTVEPRFRVPYRKNQLGWNVYAIVPDKTLECRYCQSTMNFMYNHDFRNCFYGDRKCVSMLTLEKWVDALEKVLC